jgi:hypothetical protein
MEGNSRRHAMPVRNLPASSKLCRALCLVTIGFSFPATMLTVSDYELHSAAFPLSVLLLIVTVLKFAMPPGLPLRLEFIRSQSVPSDDTGYSQQRYGEESWRGISAAAPQ